MHYTVGANLRMAHHSPQMLLEQVAREAGLTVHEIIDEFGESTRKIYAESTNSLERRLKEFFGLTR